ncbi:MAG: hypothetical protein R6U15_05970 [Candidatus Izemoplasmatales bacterium]
MKNEMRKYIATSLSDFLYENSQIENTVDIYMMGDTKREMFIFLVVDEIGIGGQYSGISPIDGENQFVSMKVGINNDYKGKGYGYLLYMATLSVLGNIGLSPHRKPNSTQPDAIKVWNKLNNESYIKRIILDEKINNNELLDSKYILTDKNKRIKNIKKISSDAFDVSNNLAKQSWNIVNGHMDRITH